MALVSRLSAHSQSLAAGLTNISADCFPIRRKYFPIPIINPSSFSLWMMLADAANIITQKAVRDYASQMLSFGNEWNCNTKRCKKL